MDGRAAIALVRSASLSSLVEAEVMRLILSGDLEAGQQIKEIAIASRLGVGRSSVREALRALEAVGLVRIEKNRGAFVRKLTETEIQELYVVREQLEVLAGRLLAKRITDEEIAELRGYIEALESYVEPENFQKYFPLNLKFHRRIFEMAGNARLLDMYQRLINELHTVRRNGLLSGGGLAVSNEEHRRIVEALAARDADAAAEAMRAQVVAGERRRRAPGCHSGKGKVA
ncbi:MAG TPA: GntR family transcriptional regulator [Hyphomicrobiaceae bacterium]|nr:GntR family transcriptional regulator [Hyphomicrobiaceae bacterium]